MARVYQKGVHYSPSTEFKVGSRSPRYLPVGTRKKWGKYIRVKVGEHGHADSNWRFEHVLVAEKMLGRQLYCGEHVHHINCISSDNRPENLYVCSNSKHRRVHSFEQLICSLMEASYISFDRTEGKYYVIRGT